MMTAMTQISSRVLGLIDSGHFIYLPFTSFTISTCTALFHERDLQHGNKPLAFVLIAVQWLGD